jgi:hypothetical protein
MGIGVGGSATSEGSEGGRVLRGLGLEGSQKVGGALPEGGTSSRGGCGQGSKGYRKGSVSNREAPGVPSSQYMVNGKGTRMANQY